MHPCESMDSIAPLLAPARFWTDRWTLLIAREMLAGITRFNDLERGLPGISRTLLVQRLDWLEGAGVGERVRRPDGRTSEYHLTRAGQELQRVVDAVGTWGARWAFGDIRPSELDPLLLLWMMRRRLRQRQLPSRRIVVEFRFPGSRPEWLWLVIDRLDTSVCLKHLRFDPVVRITAELAAFYNVWLGRATIGSAMRAQQVQVDGDVAITRTFFQWLKWSPMAKAVRQAHEEGLLGAG
jgi:DNA-binding HxlR family transcriptional regulator